MCKSKPHMRVTVLHATSYGNSNKNKNMLYAMDYNDIDELLEAVAKQLDESLPAGAVWSRLSWLLSQRQQHRHHGNPSTQTHDILQRKKQIFSLLKHTMNSIDTYRQKELTTIILSMAKIASNVQFAKSRRRMNPYQQSFSEILLDSNSAPSYEIFTRCAKAANEKLQSFEARYLANLAYAFALLGYDPQLDSSCTLLENVAGKSVECIKQFEPQGISNIVWSLATLKVPHLLLFQTVGDTVVGMPDLRLYKPQELSNIVWAFATAGIKHSDLFETIGDSIVESDDLRPFKPQEQSNIVWAFATAGIHHSRLFMKVGDHISGLSDLSTFHPQALANIAWAYAKAAVQHTGLMYKVGNHIHPRDCPLQCGLLQPLMCSIPVCLRQLEMQLFREI